MPIFVAPRPKRAPMLPPTMPLEMPPPLAPAAPPPVAPRMAPKMAPLESWSSDIAHIIGVPHQAAPPSI